MKRIYFVLFAVIFCFNNSFSQIIIPKNSAANLNNAQKTARLSQKEKPTHDEHNTSPLHNKVMERMIAVKLTDADIKLIHQAVNTQEMQRFGIPHLDMALNQYPIKSISQPFPLNAKSPRTAKRYELTKIFEIEFADEVPLLYIIKVLNQTKLFEYVEPIYIRQTNATPNDPLLTNQQIFLEQIKAFDAWDIHKGELGGEILIGICDSGTEWYHSDLVANLWMNLDEDANGNGTTIVWDAGLGRYKLDPGDINGIDDDGNGKVDDLVGWNFWIWDGTPARDPNGSSNNSHGTHVAGIAAGVTNNSNGIASISWNVKFLPTKHSSNSSGALIYFGYHGIVYLTEMGAHIINCSWGGDGFSFVEKDVIDFARDEDVVIFASAGNDYIDKIQYPSGYPGVINIASVNRFDNKTDYSTCGISVDACAPGGESPGIWFYSTIPNNIYSYKYGTSMATPFVAGAFALLKSYRDTWTNEQLVKQFLGSCDDISTENPGYDDKLGYGRINAHTSLSTTNKDISKQLKLHVITHYAQDNDNGLPEYGESCNFVFLVQNFNPVHGSSQLNFTLTCDDPDITINNGSGTISIPKDEIVTSSVLTFDIAENAETKTAFFKLKFTSPDGIAIGDEFELPIFIIGKDANQILTGSSEGAYEMFPMDRYYNYSTCEMIYLQSEMGPAATISAIGFLKDNGWNTSNINNVKIYFKHTSGSTLDDGTYSLTGYTLVFNGAFENMTEWGWQSVQLDQFFQYDGTSNLQVLIIKGYQDYTSYYPEWNYYSTANTRIRYDSDDDVQPTYLNSNYYMPVTRFGTNQQFPNYVYIGNGLVSTNGIPLSRYYEYNVTESIFYQFEIGGPETFGSIHFKKHKGNDIDDIEDVQIYLKHTTANTLSSGNYSTAGYTKVFDGNVTQNKKSGWIIVPFDTEFEYNGTDNLQVLIVKGFQEWIEEDLSPFWYLSTVSQSRTRFVLDDGTPPTFLTIDYFIPNIRFGKPIELPVVTTANITQITKTTAKSGGEVTGEGSAPVTAKGICWATTQNPTISKSHSVNGNGLGEFQSDLSNLQPGTTYYVRAYATNAGGTSYGVEKTFTTSAPIPPSSSWNFTEMTGNNAILILPTSINPKIDERNFAKGDAIGFFYKRNNQFVCGGYGIWNNANLAITVWGDDTETPLKDGFAPNEDYTVKIWDAQEGRDYDAEVTYSSGNAYYTVDGYSVIGSLNVVTTVIHQINMANGWNLVSTNIEPINPDIENIFSSIADDISIVKNNFGEVYMPEFEINDIGNWNFREGYQVHTKKALSLNIEGLKIKPENTPISLASGWNIVAYLRDNAMDIELAMQTLTDDEALIIAKNNFGQVYYPLFGINDIGNMLPGQGYQIYLIKASVLQYPQN